LHKEFVSWDIMLYSSVESDVLEECVASISRVEEYAKQETNR
jgi:hypothetical protein